jgi:ubiquitin C-terminal hydrolase
MEDINYDKDCGPKSATCGLDNLGNTCFMSSALHCMSNCPELTRYLLGKEWTKSINAVNTIGSQGKLLCAYATLLRKLWVSSGYKSNYAPKSFKNTLGKDIRQVIIFSRRIQKCHESLKSNNQIFRIRNLFFDAHNWPIY